MVETEEVLQSFIWHKSTDQVEDKFLSNIGNHAMCMRQNGRQLKTIQILSKCNRDEDIVLDVE